MSNLYKTSKICIPRKICSKCTFLDGSAQCKNLFLKGISNYIFICIKITPVVHHIKVGFKCTFCHCKNQKWHRKSFKLRWRLQTFNHTFIQCFLFTSSVHCKHGLRTLIHRNKYKEIHNKQSIMQMYQQVIKNI